MTDLRLSETELPRYVHRFSLFTTFCTIILLLAGAMVTSTGSGLSVPDWPLSYGRFFPPMIGGIFYEHGHRMIAGTVAIFTVINAFLIQRHEYRAWVKVLAWGSVFLVFSQALLGGLTVIFLLPASISIAHATLAQTFFCTLVVLCLVTSRYWQQPFHFSINTSQDFKTTSRVALLMTGLFFIQLVIGATVRHRGAGLAIPDFPTAFGGLVPYVWNFEIAIHFAHRMGACFVTLTVFYLSYRVIKYHAQNLEFIQSLLVLLGLVFLQWMLGASIIWLGRPVWITSVHLVIGALSLATSVVISGQFLRYRLDSNAWFPKLYPLTMAPQG